MVRCNQCLAVVKDMQRGSFPGLPFPNCANRAALELLAEGDSWRTLADRCLSTSHSEEEEERGLEDGGWRHMLFETFQRQVATGGADKWR